MCVKYVLQINCTDWLFRSNGKVISGLFKHNFVGLNNMDFLVFLRFFVGVLRRANKGGLCITFEKKLDSYMLYICICLQGISKSFLLLQSGSVTLY